MWVICFPPSSTRITPVLELSFPGWAAWGRGRVGVVADGRTKTPTAQDMEKARNGSQTWQMEGRRHPLCKSWRKLETEVRNGRRKDEDTHCT